MRVRRTLAAALTASATAIGLTAVAVPTTNATTTPTAAEATSAAAPAAGDRALLRSYAKDTWRSFTAMVDEQSGLPADNVGGDLTAGSRSAYTSPTNIGAYLWSTVVARDLGFV